MASNNPGNSFAKHFANLKRILQNAWAKTKTSNRTYTRKSVVVAICGEQTEEEKAVVRTGWYRIIAHCKAHALPVSAIITLSYLNWVGFFIGASLQGQSDEASQSIYQLCLQVTAKLLELLVIASLSVILMDAVRIELLYGKEGIPLGLLTAKFRFGDIRYIISPEFRAGCHSFRRLRTRFLFGVLITACALIAVLIGPSTAILMIPTWREAWPAGSAKFWMNGDLYPTTMARLSSWKAICDTSSRLSGSDAQSNLTESAFAPCIWAGYPYLANAFVQRASSNSPSITYSDGSFKRSIRLLWGVPDENTTSTWWSDSARVAAVASNVAIGSFSRYIGQAVWCQSLTSARKTSPGGSFSNLKYRQRNATRGSVKGKLPVVRTQCTKASPDMGALANIIPGLSTADITLPFPIIPDHEGRRDLRYFIPVRHLDTTHMATQWVPIPQGPYNTSYGQAIDQHPSAFLVLQNFGLYGLSEAGQNATVTCSVQADWVPGTHVASELCFEQQRSIEHQGVLDDRDPIDAWSIRSQTSPSEPTFRKARGWQHVNLSLDWLNSLTPALASNDTGRTTLASVIQDTLSRTTRNFTAQGQSPGHVEINDLRRDEVMDTFLTISSIVASFVADGMSRVAYSENYADEVSMEKVSNGLAAEYPWHWDRGDWRGVYDAVINNKAELHPDEAHRETLGRTYTWYATVEGYGLQATSKANYLAFTVVYAYLVLVMVHLGYTFAKRRISDSWSTITELLVLSQSSPPPPPQDTVLNNTSAGVASYKTLGLKMRVRESINGASGSERLQLLIGDDGKGPHVKQVDTGEEYGVRT